MDNFSLIVELPTLYDEKEAKELKSSLDNLLHDCFKVFEVAAREIHSDCFKCGIDAEFDNGDVFHIIMKCVDNKQIVAIGFENAYGELDPVLTYKQAMCINKYALEISLAINRQKTAIYKGEFPDTPVIEGVYSLPTSRKMPIYKSRDEQWNFSEGKGSVKFRQNSR